MPTYTTIHDASFDEPITLRDAYRIMERLVEAHLKRGAVSNADFLSYVGILPNGESGDPAALDDFLATAAEYLVRRRNQP